MLDVIRHAWASPFTTKSDFAKSEADWVAAAASLGFITTLSGPHTMGRRWLASPEGLAVLFGAWPK